MQRVINFSGGQSSAYMTITEYRPGDIVLFCDTGREHPKTYKFINDFEAFENIPVLRASYPGGFDGMLQKSGYRRIPNQRMRICTEDLKINTAKRFLKAQGILSFESFIGFRADEKRRVLHYKTKWKSVFPRFPLYERGINKAMVDQYWMQKPYRLEIPRILGNCTLCFMKGQNAIMRILREYPELAEPWIADEKQAEKSFGHTYFKGITIERLRDLAQHHLFSEVDLGEVFPAFECACTA